MRKEKSELAKQPARVTPNSDSARPGTVPVPKGTSALHRLRLRVTASAESMIRGGHPWLFADSIREQNREGEAGELAVVYDRKDKFLAVGLFDPESPLRVRLLHAGKPMTIDDAWWRENFSKAFRRRENL